MSTESGILDRWFTARRDSINKLIGSMKVQESEYMGGDMGAIILDYIKELYEMGKSLHEKIEKLRETHATDFDRKMSELKSQMDSRDEKITKFMMNVQRWMREYQPTLDEAKKDYEKARRAIET